MEYGIQKRDGKAWDLNSTKSCLVKLWRVINEKTLETDQVRAEGSGKGWR